MDSEEPVTPPDRDIDVEIVEAAARYEDETGESSIGRSAPAFMRMSSDGTVETFGVGLDRPGRIDHFARRGISRVDRPLSELPAGRESVRLRANPGTSPQAAIGEVLKAFDEEFGLGGNGPAHRTGAKPEMPATPAEIIALAHRTAAELTEEMGLAAMGMKIVFDDTPYLDQIGGPDGETTEET